MAKHLDQTLGVLTGAVGDYLARTGNALATPMTWAHAGELLPADPAALRRAFPQASSRIAVLIHGLMATELAFAFRGAGEPRDYGTELEARGWSSLRVRYNTGLSLKRNAGDLADLLEASVKAWPVPVSEIALIGHSLGGLLLREAAALATQRGMSWPGLVRHVACLATPHHGAPLERMGRWVSDSLRRTADPLGQLISQWADLRSVGIQQLGAVATDFWLPHARHLLVASSLAGHSPLSAAVGDGMVSLQSALAQAPGSGEVPQVQRHILSGLHHATLAFSTQVNDLLLAWLPAYSQPQPLSTPSMAEAEPTPMARRHLFGAVLLARDAVRHGHRSIERLQLDRADQLLEVVTAVLPAAADAARGVHAVHEGLVVLHHGAIEAGLVVVEGVVAVVESPRRP